MVRKNTAITRERSLGDTPYEVNDGKRSNDLVWWSKWVSQSFIEVAQEFSKYSKLSVEDSRYSIDFLNSQQVPTSDHSRVCKAAAEELQHRLIHTRQTASRRRVRKVSNRRALSRRTSRRQ